MHTRTLARARLDGAGWAHPYPTGRFDPFLYADGAPTPEGTPPPAPTAPPVPAPPAAPAAGAGGEDIASLPDWAQKQIADLRAEAGKSRTVAKQNAAEQARSELVAQFAEVLGYGEAKPPTADELAAQLRDTTAERTAAQEAAAAAAIELHVYRTAARLGADPDALLDSRAFCDAIDALDPDQPPEQFNASVQQAIEAAMGRNPAFRARGGAGRSGGDMGGAGSSGDQPNSLEKQIAEATARRDFTTVIRLKRQQAAQT